MFTRSTIQFGTNNCKSELYVPASGKPNCLVVVAYGVDGFENTENGPWQTLIGSYAEMLASIGHAAMIPMYIEATGIKPGIGAFAKINSKRDEWQSIVAEAIDHRSNLDLQDKINVGLLGFSLGGHLCVRLRSKAKVLVSYFAPVLDGLGNKGTMSNALLHHGTGDVLVPDSDARVIEKILMADKTKVKFCSYKDATHGFPGPGKPDDSARTKSKKVTTDFIKKHL